LRFRQFSKGGAKNPYVVQQPGALVGGEAGKQSFIAGLDAPYQLFDRPAAGIGAAEMQLRPDRMPLRGFNTRVVAQLLQFAAKIWRSSVRTRLCFGQMQYRFGKAAPENKPVRFHDAIV
jgi:hypothetical protein